MSGARANALRSRKFATRAAFVAVLVGAFSGWGLITGVQIIHPAYGYLGLLAGIFSAMAYRAAHRWQDLDNDERNDHA